jgi:cold shock CspA family protein
MNGVLKNWNFERGFGWIEVSGRRYFLHRTNWVDSGRPVVGQQVVFDLGPGAGGHKNQAINARNLITVIEETVVSGVNFSLKVIS